MDTDQILERSKRCLHNLEGLPSSLGQEWTIWKEETQLKINLFTSKLGVFATGALSIEHRLRRNAVVAKGILQILDAICLNLEGLLTALGPHRAAAGPEGNLEETSAAEADLHHDSETSSDSGASHDDDVEACSEDGIDDAVGSDKAQDADGSDPLSRIRTLRERISEGAGDLLRYAALIKRQSRTKSKRKVDEYSPSNSDDDQDDDGDGTNDEDSPNHGGGRARLSSKFSVYAEQVLRRELGPQRYADPLLAPLIDRLRSSMLRRWRRVCYRHAHAKNLAARTRRRRSSHETFVEPSRMALPPAETEVPRPQAEPPPSREGSMASHYPQSAATTLQSSFSISKIPQLRSETAKSSSRVGGTELSLPPIPTHQRLDEGYVYDCPYCGRLPMTRKAFTARSWRSVSPQDMRQKDELGIDGPDSGHLWADLLPYTCLCSTCPRADAEYSSFNAWIEHTSAEHWETRWACAICSEHTAGFTTKESFISHLETSHATDEGITNVSSVERYSRLGPLYSECPICGSEEGIENAIQDAPHSMDSPARQVGLKACIANHLEALALNSLPWHFGSCHHASSSQAQGTDLRDDASKGSSRCQSPSDLHPETTGGSATLAAIQQNADLEGERDVLDLVSHWDVVLEVTLTDEEQEEHVPSLGSVVDHREVRAIYDFEAETKDRLRFKRDDVIRLLDDVSDAWWEGQIGDSVGRFPAFAVTRVTGHALPPPKPPNPRLLSTAAETGDRAVVKLLLDTNLIDFNTKDQTYGQTPLLRAAKQGRADIVALLLQDGRADPTLPDNFGHPPIGWAARNGHSQVVRLLLDAGVKGIDLNNNWPTRTPLSQAAENGHSEVVAMLLKTGRVDVNSKHTTELQTPLWWAVKNGHSKVVDLLLKQEGIDVDAADKPFGQTPLSVAAEQGLIDIAKCLLRAGANRASKDTKEGLTPFGWAQRNGHREVATQIEGHRRL